MATQRGQRMVEVSYEDWIRSLSIGEAEAFRSLADKALSLGYRVKRDKAAHPSFSFASSRYRQTILRLIDDGKKTFIRIKFYGASPWSEPFEKALRETIEESDFRYTGCYGCGKCKKGPVGYHIAYGERQYFRCGNELIEFFELNHATVGEAGTLLERQTDFWEKRLLSEGPSEEKR